jgi:hypothetical protein
LWKNHFINAHILYTFNFVFCLIHAANWGVRRSSPLLLAAAVCITVIPR